MSYSRNMQETVTASVLDLVGKIDSIERETEDIYLRLGKVFRAVKSAVDASAAEAEQAIAVALGFHRGGSSADIAGDIVIETPISCAVSGGFVLGCEGGTEAERLEGALRKGMDMASSLVGKGGMSPEEALRYATNARHLGELGIGLNTEARIGGNMLEDEKVYGTCHFAIGFNFDEDAPAMIHLDGLVARPTISALMPDGREITVMKNGDLFSCEV